MTNYQVTGPLAIVKGKDGKIRYCYTGSPIPSDIDDEQVQRLVVDGLVSEVGDDGNVVDPSKQSTEIPSGAPVARPSQVAPKSAWVDYAVSRGMDRRKAESLDKRELIDAFPAE